MEIDNPEEHEASHVHRVYQQIAPHFSATRVRVGRSPSSYGAIGVDIRMPKLVVATLLTRIGGVTLGLANG